MSIGLGNDIYVGRRHMGVRLTGGGAAAPALDADAATLIAAMTTEPDATRQGLIDDLIVGLKTDGVWAELDELWVTAAHAEQAALLGWKRAHDLTAVNAPTFTTDRGFTGNGTTSYLNTNFVPSTDGVQYTQNDASMGVYSRTNSQLGRNDMGGRTSSNSGRAYFQVRTTGDLFNVDFNNAAFANRPSVANTNSSGFFAGRRTGASATQALKNGAVVATGTDSSSSLTNVALLIGGYNDAGTPGSFSTRQYAAAFVGAAMSEAQQLALYNRLQTYMTAVGANV